MLKKIVNTLAWLPNYYRRRMSTPSLNLAGGEPFTIYFCICDHYEPYWHQADDHTAQKRIQKWLNEYPAIAEKYPDSAGNVLKYSFFYPEEEYRYEDMKQIEQLCRAGFGEVEVHLHHDQDNPGHLRKTLLDYKKRLFNDHGLLSQDKLTGDIAYGFIHGNWALDNSRPDGQYCGINNELNILQETGCYADFTMPSAPDVTQTRKVNSIYYALDDPDRPKSHDTGIDAAAGQKGEGLLMVQGPLSPNWKHRRLGILPAIENGGLMANNPPTKERIDQWIAQNIHVKSCPQAVFVKIYTHGTQEPIMDMLFDNGHLAAMLEYLTHLADEAKSVSMRFVSAREMANTIRAIEQRETITDDVIKNYWLVPAL